jgi:hypothetical protein
MHETLELIFTRHIRPLPLGEKVGGQVILHGWSLTCVNAVTDPEVDIYDGQDANGLLVAPVIIGATGPCTDTRWFGPPGIRLNNGLFTRTVTGLIEGSIFYSVGDW